MRAGETGWAGGLEAASNILARSADQLERAAICRAFYDQFESPRSLVVSYDQSIEDWLTAHQHTPLESVAFVSVGEPVRSTTAATPTETPAPAALPMEPRLDGVSDPTDLTALGLTIHSHLREFTESGDEIVLCFDSLSALAETVSLQRAFQFLHILTNLSRALGVTAHYHYDSTIPTQDLDTLRVLFDAELDTGNSHDTSTWTLGPNR